MISNLYLSVFSCVYWASLCLQASPNRSLISSPEQREAMYSFCYNEKYGPCSLVTFNSIDDSSDSTDWVLSDNFYQLQLGACADSFSTTEEAWCVTF